MSEPDGLFRCRCDWCRTTCDGHHDRVNKHLNAVPVGQRVDMICDSCKGSLDRLTIVTDTYITRAINGVLGRK